MSKCFGKYKETLQMDFSIKKKNRKGLLISISKRKRHLKKNKLGVTPDFKT